MESPKQSTERQRVFSAHELENSAANHKGEYKKILLASADVMTLASRILTEAEEAQLVIRFKNAKNSLELWQVMQSVTRKLYREAIDYSSVLYRRGVINKENWLALKNNIARGKEFTTRDLADADKLSAVVDKVIAGTKSSTDALVEFQSIRWDMNKRKESNPPVRGDDEVVDKSKVN